MRLRLNRANGFIECDLKHVYCPIISIPLCLIRVSFACRTTHRDNTSWTLFQRSFSLHCHVMLLLFLVVSYFSQLLLLIVFIIGLHMKMTKIPIYIISAFESWNRHILPIACWASFVSLVVLFIHIFRDSFWIIIYN